MSHAAHKWATLLVDIVLYEVSHTQDGELLSEFCDRMIHRSPLGARVLILSVGTALTLHLANALDPRYDPIAKQFWVNVLARVRR